MTEHVQILGIPPRIQCVANGQNQTFEFPFAIFKNQDLKVYLNEEQQPDDTYTVTGAGQTNGGSVRFHTAPANHTIVTLMRDLKIERTTDFQEGGALRANVLNGELDYQIACQQQIADSLNRSMVLPPYAVNVDVDLTLPIPEAGKAIVWNDDGTNLENSTVSVNALEKTLHGYKESAESAAATATTQSEQATAAATTALEQATIATQKATEADQSASAVNSAFATKANRDMDNLSQIGTTAVAHYAMPSDNYINLSVGASGATYIAPANGYFCANSANLNCGKIFLYNPQTGLASVGIDINNVTDGTAFLPVKKDGEVIITYTGAWGQNGYLRFIYAEGEI